ncbi:MAG TPA: DUF1295 domain-containing protein [Candidatus Saccharimonadales bacterium]
MIAYITTLLIIMLLYMTLWFGISVIQKRSDVADIAWGLGFVLIAWSAYYLVQAPGWLAPFINILVTIWGLRLSIHIYLRNRHKTEDKRYTEMRAKWGGSMYLQSYIRIFLGQGILLLLISTPVILANLIESHEIMPRQYIGIAIWLIGFLFESIGDWQLSRFMRNPANKGKLMTTGLWRYTRHPNYFGEVIQWWGIWFTTLVLPEFLIGVIGPATITILILKVSGIPLLETKMKANPQFAEYAQKTSEFWPLPPRR